MCVLPAGVGQAICAQGELRRVENSLRASHSWSERGIELASQAVADSIRENSIEVKGHDDIAHVASISAADTASALKKNLDGYESSLEARTVGRIAEVGDGIARVSGLPDCAVNELLEFEDGSVGLALNLDEDSIGAVVLGDTSKIEEGQTVKRTGRVLRLLDGRLHRDERNGTENLARPWAPEPAAPQLDKRAFDGRRVVQSLA